MFKANFLVIGLSLMFLVGCGNSNSRQNTTNTEVSTEKENPKIALFSEIDKTIAWLTLSGIGQLGNWQSDGMGEYFSVSPYYQFGSGTPQNNLAYNLVSENSKYIQKVNLILNINNGSERKQALQKFSEIAKKTLETLEIKIPEGLINAAKTGREFNFENDTYLVSVKLDKSNIEIFTLLIQSK